MTLDERSKYLRRLILRAMRSGRRGHWGSAASLVEILRVIYDIKKPQDKVILSKGHSCLALYAILAEQGLIPMEELDRFCHKDGMLGGHPSPHIPGVLCHTGSLGHGLSIGVGMAIAAKIQNQNHRIFVIMGDGEINEGSVWEAAMSAGKHKLDNLTAIIDYNGIQSAGLINEIQPLEPLAAKWRAFGWACYSSEGHNLPNIQGEMEMRYPGPNCLLANTIKGKGIPYLENSTDKHYLSRLTDDDLARMEAALA